MITPGMEPIKQRSNQAEIHVAQQPAAEACQHGQGHRMGNIGTDEANRAAAADIAGAATVMPIAPAPTDVRVTPQPSTARPSEPSMLVIWVGVSRSTKRPDQAKQQHPEQQQHSRQQQHDRRV